MPTIRMKRLSVALDLLALCVSVAFALSPESLSIVSVLGFTLMAAAAWLVASQALDYYETARPPLEDATMSGILVASVVAEVTLAHLLAPETLPALSVGRLLVLWPIAYLLRISLCPWPASAAPEEVLIVGSSALARATADDLECGHPRRSVIGFLSLPSDPPAAPIGPPVLGSASGLAILLASTHIDEVYIAGELTHDEAAMRAAVRTCESFGVPFAVALPLFVLRRARPGACDGYVHYSAEPPPLHRQLKRVFDILASAMALWLLSPLLLLIAAGIKLTSRGPVFFRQTRVGRHGRHFSMLKFRSMVVDAEAKQAALLALNEQTGPVFKIRKDPRITPLGRFLRKHSLDELPQIVNVLRGEMSVVGPRPPIPSEVAKYETWQRRRLSVRPGLTCLWQVGGRNHISFEEWMYLDMRYIDHWNLGTDLGLIFKTIPVVLTGDGAS